jgi:preprotein translocase subunit SecA
MNDLVYRTAQGKVRGDRRRHPRLRERGQPVLVGTTSIENSELLSALLTKEKLPHQVLNAKQHAREAEIVAQAGRPGAVTIATNMAGRGTDIVLGGNIEKQIATLRDDETLATDERESAHRRIRAEWQKLHDQVIAAGGLHIIGTERHESRRIDNQLRGRSGRQGDPGRRASTCRWTTPAAHLRRRSPEGDHGALKMPEGEAIEHPLVNRARSSRRSARSRRNFDIRKQLLEYDDVANDQRKVIYAQRNELLEADDISETITAMREGVLHDTFRLHVPADSVEEQWDLPGLEKALAADLQLEACRLSSGQE